MADDSTLPVNESPESSPATNTPISLSDMDTDDFVPGELTSFDYSPEPFADLSEKGRNALHELVILASRTDVASRRFEVEMAWEARLFERGYQHLLPRRGGGWSLPGEGSKWGPLSTADSSALYSTNIYGRDKDIIVAAIARETPRIQFFPKDSRQPVDIMAAEASNRYKCVYEKNNNLRERLAELAYFYYTEDRSVLYTRLVVDAQRFGTNEDGSPKGKEITTVVGKLEAKVPMQAQCQGEMHFVQIYNETDVTTAKARYPWAAKKIRPGSCGIGEIELDKIARVNTKLALLGSYVTGDAMMREVTEQYTWVRPEMFWDDAIDEEVRQELMDAFPKGALIVYAGQEFCFARSESMDDHIVVSHAMPGIGQNRRALGTNNISVQKRLNAYLDIMDDFFRKTVPRRLYDSEAFDVDALKLQDNVPGGSTPFLRQPGIPVDQLVFIEPTPQPQPALPEFAKLFFDEIPASLSGAVPSLFGGSTNTDTVGGIEIQRDQALARIGVAWTSAKEAIAQSTKQAVLAATSRPDTINETLPGDGSIIINPNDLKGNVVCYPEYDSSFPESFRERETRFTEIVANAPQNPFYAALLKNPGNMRAIADNTRMSGIQIPGEDSAKKQLIEIEQLKTSAPLPNPKLLQAQQQIEQAKMGMTADIQSGTPVPPQATAMFQQAQQAIAAIPPEVSSLSVAQDMSENHAIEAQVCFDWMNGEEGVKFKYGVAEQQAGFQNVYLHWQEHTAIAKQNAPAPETAPPHLSIPYDKLPPEAKAQALAKAGIKTTPKSTTNAKLVETQHEISKRVVPKTVPNAENITVKRLSRPRGDA